MLRTLLIDRHGEVRISWRIALAVVLPGVCITATLLLVFSAGWTDALGTGLGALVGAGASGWALTRFLNKKPFSAIGTGISPNPLPDLLGGLILGSAAIACLCAMLAIAGYVSFVWRGFPAGDVVRVTAYAALTALTAAAAEELVFRGYLFQTLVQAITLLPASLLVSGLFAVAHLWNPGFTPLGAMNIGIAGLLFSVAYAKTGRLWLPLGIHAGWNFAQLTLGGYPVSGLVDPDRMLCTATVTGPEWWTGGGFGPEGGLAATVALIGCAWVVLRAGRFQRPPGLVTLDTLEDLLATSKN
jgi:membrane protease YdiL (CAAX protease family)